VTNTSQTETALRSLSSVRRLVGRESDRGPGRGLDPGRVPVFTNRQSTTYCCSVSSPLSISQKEEAGGMFAL
jgi:hypothetical protein